MGERARSRARSALARAWNVADAAVGGRLPRLPLRLDPQRSALPRRTMRRFQAASFRYTFDGVPCIKNPFDLALYTRLLAEVRPRTIVEIGSAGGGGAGWFAAQARGLRLDTRVYSFDLYTGAAFDDPTVEFLQADIHHLEDSALPGILAGCPRPLLVVEDGPHTYEGCLAALRFFDGHLLPGEYIVVEDGVVRDLGIHQLHNGPNRAIDRFLDERGADYEVDRDYCDFFGRNVTWNPNGYLRRRS